MATRRTSMLTKSVFAAGSASRTSHNPFSRSHSARVFSVFAPAHASENSRNSLCRSQIIDTVAATNVAFAKFLSHSFTRSFHASNPSYRSAGSAQVEALGEIEVATKLLKNDAEMQLSFL